MHLDLHCYVMLCTFNLLYCYTVYLYTFILLCYVTSRRFNSIYDPIQFYDSRFKAMPQHERTSRLFWRFAPHRAARNFTIESNRAFELNRRIGLDSRIQ